MIILKFHFPLSFARLLCLLCTGLMFVCGCTGVPLILPITRKGRYFFIKKECGIGLVAAELRKPAELSWLDPWYLEILMNVGRH